MSYPVVRKTKMHNNGVYRDWRMRSNDVCYGKTRREGKDRLPRDDARPLLRPFTGEGEPLGYLGMLATTSSELHVNLLACRAFYKSKFHILGRKCYYVERFGVLRDFSEGN